MLGDLQVSHGALMLDFPVSKESILPVQDMHVVGAMVGAACLEDVPARFLDPHANLVSRMITPVKVEAADGGLPRGECQRDKRAQ